MEIFSSKPQQMKLHKDANPSKDGPHNYIHVLEQCALKLKQDLQEDSQQTFANALPNQKSKLESCLSDVEATARSFRDLLQVSYSFLSSPVFPPLSFLSSSVFPALPFLPFFSIAIPSSS
eukprot:m.678119 g.678119  ORF g.678119 m.678119 type:complete len:120 (-) comp58577_c0_seq29:36-395(-)